MSNTSIFDKNYEFRPKFFISIVDQIINNYNQIRTQISIFGQTFRFLGKIWIIQQNLDFWEKFRACYNWVLFILLYREFQFLAILRYPNFKLLNFLSLFSIRNEKFNFQIYILLFFLLFLTTCFGYDIEFVFLLEVARGTFSLL